MVNEYHTRRVQCSRFPSVQLTQHDRSAVLSLLSLARHVTEIPEFRARLWGLDDVYICVYGLKISLRSAGTIDQVEHRRLRSTKASPARECSAVYDTTILKCFSTHIHRDEQSRNGA